MLICGMEEVPLDLFMRDLKQNEKDQADLSDDDVMEVRNGETFCLAKRSMSKAIIELLSCTTHERLQASCDMYVIIFPQAGSEQ